MSLKYELSILSPITSNESATSYDSEEYTIEVTTGHPVDSLQKILREKKTFDTMKSKLLSDPNYRDKYVAIHNGQLLDSDSDWSTLAERVYQAHGYHPILIEKVTRKTTKVRLGRPHFKIN